MREGPNGGETAALKSEQTAGNGRLQPLVASRSLDSGRDSSTKAGPRVSDGCQRGLCVVIALATQQYLPL